MELLVEMAFETGLPGDEDRRYECPGEHSLPRRVDEVAPFHGLCDLAFVDGPSLDLMRTNGSRPG